jgi:PrtD family type I secretion system ABC transporter
VRQIFAGRRRALTAAFLFSGAINLLMLVTPIYSMQVFTNVVPTGSLETLVSLSLMATFALSVLALLEALRERMLVKAGLWLDFHLASAILQRWAAGGPAQGADPRSEARLAQAVKTFSTGQAINPLFDAPWIPIFLIALFILHPLLGLVGVGAALLLGLCALITVMGADGTQAEAARAQEGAERWFQGVTADHARTQGAGLASATRPRWEGLAEESSAAAYSAANRTGTVKAFARFIRHISQIAIFAVGAWVVVRQEATASVLIASSILMARALAPLEQSVALLKVAVAASKATRKLKSLALPELPSATGADCAQCWEPTGRISLSDVGFAYPGRSLPALRGITLALEPGLSLGIIGPNGSGKSTLAQIIAGALEPRTGAADLDGMALAKWQQSPSLPLIGYAGHAPALFDGTVHENIVRFRDAGLMSAAQAAMRAGVHEILSDLPQGYDTRLTADGAGLSPRETRAIALARAVHGPTRLIVLDEPEAGLDGAGEKRLIRTLAELKKEGVQLVIATQQPRLLQLTEQVVLLQKGAVEIFGPAAEVARRIQGGKPQQGQAQAREQGPAQPTVQRPAEARARAETLRPRARP